MKENNPMKYKEFKNMQRILEIMKDPKTYSREDIKMVLYAFRKLVVLKKENMPPEIISKGKRAFELGREEYVEKMKWINKFMTSKGFDENIFTDLNDYEQSCDDYDYYYELKTPTQYREDEEARKGKKREDEEIGE